MSQYILVYKGEATDMSDMTPEEGAEVMAKWGVWMQNVGGALTDIGSPFGPGSSVVDDGSSDNTMEVAAGYSDVRYIRQENKGLSAARNTGIRASKGSYLVFLDADDRLLPVALESGLKCFSDHKECAFVFGQHVYSQSNGASYQHEDTPQHEKKIYLSRLRENKDHYRSLLHGNYIGMPATVMYRRDIFQFLKGFDSAIYGANDYDLYLRISKNYPVYFHDTVVATYRLHETNISKDAGMMLNSVLSVLRLQKKHVKSDKALVEAYQAGRKFWIEYYGYDMINQIKVQLSVRGERVRAFRAMVTLMKIAPGWFSKYASKSLKRNIKRLMTSTKS